MKIQHIKDEHRYIALNESEEIMGELVYSVDTDDFTKDFYHTGVDNQFEGQGVGSELVKKALNNAIKDGITIIPSCPFVASYIENHKEYKEIIK